MNKKIIILGLLLVISIILIGALFLKTSDDNNNGDKEAPIITVDNTKQTTFNVGEEEPDWKQYFSVTDNVDGTIKVTDNMIINHIDMNESGRYPNTILVYDDAGNKAHETVLIIILGDDNKPIDKTAPTVVLDNTKQTTFVKGTEEPDWKTYFSITDDNDGEITVTDEMITSTVDMTTVGAYSVVIRVTDSDGNVAVNSVAISVNNNSNPPEITIDNTKQTMFNIGSTAPDWKTYFSVTDETDGDITVVDQMITTDVDMTTVGAYIVSIIVTNSNGYSSVKAIAISVLDQSDKTPPVITLNNDFSKKMVLGTETPDFTKYFSVVDNVDGEIAVTNNMIITDLNFTQYGLYTIVIEVVDSSGNKTVETFIFRVIMDENLFAFDESTGTILKFLKTDYTEVYIPETIKGIEVKVIAQDAFVDSYMINKVTIPRGITEIETKAFGEIKSITFESGSNLRKIHDDAFRAELARDIYLPNKLEYIGDNLFANHMLEYLVIPASVTYIGERTFTSYGNRLKLVFEENSNLKIIGQNAFEGSLSFSQITIPSSVTSIGLGAFNSNNFSSVSIENNIENSKYRFNAIWNEIGFTSVAKDVTGLSVEGDFIIDRSNDTLISYNGSNTTPTIPSDIKNIASGAFYQKNITSITIPASVADIGNNAFYNNSLTAVTFESGSSLQRIGSYAFENTGITSITIPASVINIGDNAFAFNSSLTTVTFESGSSLQRIGNNAFESTGITSIIIPASITDIGNSAFAYNSSLTTVTFDSGSSLQRIGSYAFSGAGIISITIPASVINIGNNVFAFNSSLTTVAFESGSSLQRIGSYVFENTGIASITIPASVTDIGSYAFYNVSLTTVTFDSGSSLQRIGNYAFGSTEITSITIPASVTDIGDSVFAYNSSLTAVTFESGSNLQRIGISAFENTGITSITIPVSVTDIGDSAFAYNGSLTTVTIEFNELNLKTRFNHRWEIIAFPTDQKPA